MRSEERADVAAHLHDSVLQTLALIQRSAGDPATVTRLARAQERDLRSWLFDSSAEGPATLAAALRAVAAEVEDAHGVHVEVVCVGDAPVSEEDRPLVLATREAITNAAKHSGVSTVDVYAEATPAGVEVFVRDRGTGFDAEQVADDRQGIRGSIVGRMERHGGTRLGPQCSRGGHRGPAVPPRSCQPTQGDHPMTPRTVVIVDDHAMFRTGVRSELGTAVNVLAEAADVDQAVQAVISHQPEVVLLDVHLPGGGGAEVMRRTTGKAGNTRFLALSVSDAAEDVIGTIRAGARGYVTKTITGPELVAAIERVAQGDAVFSPRLAGFVLDAFAGTIEVAAVDEDLDRLTEREREVMRLIARGYSYKEVGAELFISIKTVETHMSSVLRKLQLSSRHELTRWASDRRLL